MNIKTGIDIIEVDRIKQSIEKYGDNFLNKIFTKNEIEYCESKKVQKYLSYAARFASKEAVFKAISECLENKFDIEWKDIEVLNNENGRPYINFSEELLKKLNYNIEGIDISLTHLNNIAMASVVIQVNNA